MLSSVLSLLGVDLQQQTNQLQARAEAFRDQTIDKTAAQIKHTSLILGLALVGGVLAMVTIGIALLALYRWVESQHGDMAALAATGVATAVAAAAMFMIAATVANQKAAPVPARPIPIMPSQPVASPVSSATTILSAMVPPPPAGASLLDIVTHRVTSKAAAASDEAVTAAIEVVRTGSRSALFGTIAAVALIGLVIGRRSP